MTIDAECLVGHKLQLNEQGQVVAYRSYGYFARPYWAQVNPPKDVCPKCGQEILKPNQTLQPVVPVEPGQDAVEEHPSTDSRQLLELPIKNILDACVIQTPNGSVLCLTVKGNDGTNYGDVLVKLGKEQESESWPK